MSKIIILCGIPCSGKSTWARNFPLIISRDSIREEIYGKKYFQNRKSEEKVSRIFDKRLGNGVKNNMIVVLDNTFCKESYIDKIFKQYANYTIEIKFFEVSLIKAYIRNIKRWIETGKWIPFKVIKTMRNNFNKINKKKYEQYLFHK